VDDDHSDPSLPPIELPSANPLLNFSDNAATDALQGQYADYTSAQLNELNQVSYRMSCGPHWRCHADLYDDPLFLETAERQCPRTPVN
jgi:hypothetical protein